MTPERRTAIRERHGDPDWTYCFVCGMGSPCDAIEALDALEAANQERRSVDQRISNQRHALYWLHQDHLRLLSHWHIWRLALREIHDIAETALNWR
jgi:hypothetical protein